jgi:hypothetical protein
MKLRLQEIMYRENLLKKVYGDLIFSLFCGKRRLNLV